MDSDRLARHLNSLLVDIIKQKGNIRDPAVEGAFRSVFRHMFLPKNIALAEAYADTAVVLRRSTNPRIVPAGHPMVSSTMPSLVAAMLEAAELSNGLRLLHIGTGPGYLDALAAKLLSPDGTVTTVEINKSVSLAAAKRLRKLGFSNIECITADGVFGFSDRSPYDRIITTASCASVPEPWVDQLVDHGLLILPFALSATSTLCPIVVFRRRGNDLLGRVSSRMSMVSFLPLYGRNVPVPIRHHPHLAALERKIASELSIAAGDFEQSRTAQLAAMLHLADALNGEPDAATGLRAEDILPKTTTFLKRHHPKSVEEFLFRLSPLREDERDHLWSFGKGDRTLYVDIQS